MSSSLWHIHEHVIPASHPRGYTRSVLDPATSRLRLAVKEYVPKSSLASTAAAAAATQKDAGATIIAVHGTTMTKESWEPFFDELLHRAGRIRRVFTFDIAWRGSSYALNEDQLGDAPHWSDGARDLLQLVNYFQDRIAPPVIGLCHSWGCAVALLAASMHPRVFDAAVFIEPTFVMPPAVAELTRRVFETGEGVWTGFGSGGVKAWEEKKKDESRPAAAEGGNPRAEWTMRRQDWWPSREDARKAFLRSPFYGTFDKRVFETVMLNELRDVRPDEVDTRAFTTGRGGEKKPTRVNPGVTLATPKAQEFYIHMRPTSTLPNEIPDRGDVADARFLMDVESSNPGFYTPQAIDALAAVVTLLPPVLYLWGRESDIAKLKAYVEQFVRLTGVGRGGSGGVGAGMVEEKWVEGTGHGVPYQKPVETAMAVAEWLGQKTVAWEKEIEQGKNQRFWTKEVNPLWYGRLRGKL